ncbi:MAG: hypothetical protein M1818_000244 [Claussenomyces sp. TS43310]|nr:MAG: hypothetical protein M1818_000244 [Claussenomyces sp. TS43310]
MAEDTFEQATNAFQSWLAQVGARINPKASLVDLRAEGRGRGLVAVGGDVAEDEIIFSIPRTAILHLKNAFAHHGDHLDNIVSMENLQDMPNWLSLTIVLMIEVSHGNSIWQKYLAVLPQQLDSLVFWSPRELEDLQASAVIDKIGRADAEEQFRSRVLPLNIPGVSLDLFHKMASIIMAYAFDIPEDDPEEIEDNDEELIPDDDEEQTVLTMIPMADMLNADADRNNARLLCDHEDLEMRAIKHIKMGEEIFNDYGQLPSSDLLRRYGYITEKYAPYDVVEMSTISMVSALNNGLILDQHSKPFSQLRSQELTERLDLAKREDRYEDSYDIAHADSDQPSIPDELVALMYLLLVDEESISSLQRSETSLPSRSKLATAEVGNILGQLLKRREKEYSTSLEEDDDILRAGDSSHRKIMAVKVRRGEKQLLRAANLEASTFQGDNKRMRNKSKRERQVEVARPQKRSRHR